MQRGAVRATVGGVAVDIPFATFAAGGLLRYSLTAGPSSTPGIETAFGGGSVICLAADQTAIGTTLTALTGFPVALAIGTHAFEALGWYWSDVAATGFSIGAAFTGTSTSQVIGGHIERTTFPGLAVETTALATKAATTTLAPTTQATRLPFHVRGRIVVTVAGNFSLQVSTGGGTGTVNVEKGTAARVVQIA
jgi:hypothetical protein